MQELKLSARRLARTPGISLMAAVALGIGIGASSAIFSLLDAVVLQPLPYPDPGRLVAVLAASPDQGPEPPEVSVSKFAALARDGRAFSGVAAWHEDSFSLAGAGEPEQLPGARVSAELFRVLGVQPVLGRGFTAAEQRTGGGDVALLGEGIWRRRFGGDPGVVGRGLRLNGRAYTIVGVLPGVLRVPFEHTDVWVPRIDEPSFLTRRAVDLGSGYLNVVARLAPGSSLDAARADAGRVARAYADQLPGQVDARSQLAIEPLAERLVGPLRGLFLTLLGAVGCVLLIACADVANLLLAQGLARRREMALKTALGAGHGRILWGVLLEGLLLSLAGGAIGVATAAWGLRLLVATNPAQLPRMEQVGVNGRVLAFALAVAVLAGLLASLAPALRTLRTRAREALAESGRAATAGRRGLRGQGLLVTAEVALALLLLILSGLMLQSLGRLTRVDPGFRPEGLVSASIVLPAGKYPGVEERRVFGEALLARARALPGVAAAALVDYLPTLGAPHTPLSIEGQPALPFDRQPLVLRGIASPGLFRTLGTPLLAGRDFDPNLTPQAPLEAVVNDALRRRFFNGASPLGQRLLMGGHRVQVVGVVGDVRQQGLAAAAEPMFYLCNRQVGAELSPPPFFELMVRTTLPAGKVAGALRAAVRNLDPEQPVAEVRPVEEVIGQQLARQRLAAWTIGCFSAVALLLCLLGIYGVVSHSVSLRRKEIGVRLALGARPGQVLREVMRQGARWIAVGIAAGLGLAVLLGRALASQLYEVSPTDPAQLVGATLLLGGVALLACFLPARRAARTEPARALRVE